MTLVKLLCPLLCTGVIAACSSRDKAEVTEEAFLDPVHRRAMLEATLRVLDKHPAYVDELFELALQHRRTLDRVFANTARGLAKTDLAERVAAQLVVHPDGLRRVMIETLDAARHETDAQHAIVEAIEARAETAATYFVERHEELATDHPEISGMLNELAD